MLVGQTHTARNCCVGFLYDINDRNDISPGDSNLWPYRSFCDPRSVGSADDNRGRRHGGNGVGEPTLMYEGLERFGLNVLLIVVGGLLVVLLKQTVFHRRAPIV